MDMYGLRVPALSPGRARSGSRRLPWHDLELDVVRADPPHETRATTTDSSATLEVAGDLRVHVTRHPLAARISAARPISTNELIHPLMVYVGAAVAHWTQRTSFHAAAVVLGGKAWLFLGPPHAGKSTLAASLHARGHVVMADDLAVLDDRTVLAGPPVADLREAAARHLATKAVVSSGRGRIRWRADLGDAPYEVPLGGFVSLAWSEKTQMRRADAAERLTALARSDALWSGPVTTTAFLDLLDAPFYVLERKEDWATMGDVIRIIEGLAG